MRFFSRVFSSRSALFSASKAATRSVNYRMMSSSSATVGVSVMTRAYLLQCLPRGDR